MFDKTKERVKDSLQDLADVSSTVKWVGIIAIGALVLAAMAFGLAVKGAFGGPSVAAIPVE